MTLDRIVVGVDFRQPSLTAAQWATAQFAGRSAVELLHVDAAPEQPRFLGTRFHRRDPGDPSRAGKADGLQGFVDTLAADHVTAQVRVGNEVAELARRARMSGANLVVLGGAKASGASGRTLHRVIRTLDVPVLVVGPKGGEAPSRILVAVDDAPIAGEVVRWASVLARHFGAELTLVHVLNQHPVGAAIDGNGSDPELARRIVVNRAHGWLRQLYEQMVGEPFTGRIAVVFGVAGPALLEHASAIGAHLIVLGRNGRHAVGRTELGTVARLALRASPLPVAVVPPPGRERSQRSRQPVLGREADPLWSNVVAIGGYG